MIKVSNVQWIGGHRLRLRFSDGTTGEHDFSPLLAESGPMLEPLRDPEFFRSVFLEDGAPTWPNGYDMAPRWVQMELEAAGELHSDAA
jgi:hypothetical protein